MSIEIHDLGGLELDLLVEVDSLLSDYVELADLVVDDTLSLLQGTVNLVDLVLDFLDLILCILNHLVAILNLLL